MRLNKTCFRCKINKTVDLWPKNKARHDGLASMCSECFNKRSREKYKESPEKKLCKNKQWYSNNKDAHKKMRDLWYLNNKSQRAFTAKLYRQKNIQAISIHRKKYYEETKSVRLAQGKKHYNKFKYAYLAKYAKRRALKLQATPKWLTTKHFEQIKDIYKQAKELETIFFNRKFHVDHIVPLQGKNVCGLHVPWNLQILTAEENLSKGNRYNLLIQHSEVK